MPFNDNHKRHLRTGFQHVERLLADAQTKLAAGPAGQLFPPCLPDADPRQRLAIADYIARFRDVARQFLDTQDIRDELQPISGLWTFRGALDSALTGLEELLPRRMTGYGVMDENDARELEQTLAELRGIVQALADDLKRDRKRPSHRRTRMPDISIPGFGTLKLAHLVLDHNGTLARDGVLLPGLEERLIALAGQMEIHVLTGNTFGDAAEQLRGIPCELSLLDRTGQAEAKLHYVERLGADTCVCIGNGRNDLLMLEAAALGIAVIQQEGAAGAAVRAADVVASSIQDALDLLASPLRLVATLRT